MLRRHMVLFVKQMICGVNYPQILTHKRANRLYVVITWTKGSLATIETELWIKVRGDEGLFV